MLYLFYIFFRAVLYINDVEKGGETVFLNRKNKAMVRLLLVKCLKNMAKK